METQFKFDGGLKKISIILMLVALAALGFSFAQDKYVGWVDYLVLSLYFTTIAVSSLFFLSLSGVIQASWLTPYKRIPEAMISFLPVSLVMMLLSLFGLHSNYEWTHTEMVKNDPILSAKVAWLNEPRFIITMLIIFAVWIFIGYKHRAISNKIDSKVGLAASNSAVGFSAISIILFALTISVAGFDWIMSVEPHWFSTIFGVYIFAGSFVSGTAFVTLVLITLKEKGYFKSSVTENHYHDLGKWMFGMSVFWAYIWISQYLLIWYANIPEETEYYVLRHAHWNGIFFFNLFINFFVPFFALMTRKAKRSASVLKVVAVTLLFGHFVDMYLMIAPKVFHHHDSHISGYGVVQIAQLIGGFGLFIFVIGTALSKRKLEVENDPTFAEGSHLHQ